MKINESFPVPPALFDNEIRTLQFLRDNPFIKKHYPRLCSDAYTYLNRNFNAIKKNRLKSFNFESMIDINIDGRAGAAYVGALILKRDNNRYDQYTYYIAIYINQNSSNKFIRKFHFDYTDNLAGREKHPIFHLQYPGDFSPYLKSLKFAYEDLCDWLSEPRLACTPMSLALILNLTFNEFHNETSIDLIEHSEWRDLVRANENALLRPYYRNCHNFIANRPATELFTNDFCYGV
jgi:hypothetical protein